MKRIADRATLKLFWKLSCFFGFIALAAITDSSAGDYYIYQDSNGKLVLSNNAPPPGSKIVKKETLSETTDQEIDESRLRENQLRGDDRVASLEKTIAELTDSLRAQNQVIDNLQQGAGQTTVVAVTQGQFGNRRLPRPTDIRNNLQKVQPRGPIAAPLQQRQAAK